MNLLGIKRFHLVLQLPSTAPSYVADMMQKKPSHTRNTRYSSYTMPLLNRPAHSKATLGDRSFSCASSSVWNSIPNNISEIKDCAISDGLQSKTVTKAQKISRAMQAYMERARSYDAFMDNEIAEYELGKRHLANIMGQDPQLFDQEDINEAIEYLLPSALFSKRCRPVLKHPYEIFPKRKAQQFGMSGRPFHSMFYTGKPNFYYLCHEIVNKLEGMKVMEDRLRKRDAFCVETEKLLQLYSSEWISLDDLKDEMIEPLDEADYKRFIVLMKRLMEHPLSHQEEEFIMQYRKDIMEQTCSSSIPKPLVDDNGRQYMMATGTRKKTLAEVIVRDKGTGMFTVNGQSVLCFDYVTSREQLLAPLKMAGKVGEVDVEAKTWGEGHSVQAGAIRLALAKALTSFIDGDTVDKMRIAGLLSWDVRRREKKKAGQEGARRKFTWKKR